MWSFSCSDAAAIAVTVVAALVAGMMIVTIQLIAAARFG